MKKFLCGVGLKVREFNGKSEGEIADILGVGVDDLNTALRLFSYGIGPKTAIKIAAELSWKDIRENPYSICNVDGVGFKTADKLSCTLGIDKNSLFRIKELVKFILFDCARSNHDLYIPISELDHLCKTVGGISCAKYLNTIEGIVLDGDDVYLEEFYDSEHSVASFLCSMSDVIQPRHHLDLWHLSKDQVQAVKNACSSPVSLITGFPGTGKTTLIKIIAPLFDSVVLCPTGRSARRVKEATGVEAYTIHKFIGKPRAVDCIILDESSMIDILLFKRILDLKPKKLIIIGDPDQLDSVAAGSILLPLIESNVFPVVRLTQNFRSSSGISGNAIRVLLGKSPTMITKDFTFIECDEGSAFKRICEYSASFSPWEMQILSPMRKGICGTDNLNAVIKNIVNPETRLGDKVIVTKNDYRYDVRNGEIGRIVAHERMPIVEIEGEEKIVPWWLLDDAYAITVHKMQGSECDVVVFPVLVKHYVLLSKNLVYTGITRAKTHCILLGERKALWIAAKRAERKKRTKLAERIREAWRCRTR